MNCCEKRLCVYHVGDTIAWKGKFSNIGYDVKDSSKVTISAEFYTEGEMEGEHSSVVAGAVPDPDKDDTVVFKAQSDTLSPGALFIKVLVNVTVSNYKQYVVAQIGVLQP